jgi:hypothetical protein
MAMVVFPGSGDRSGGLCSGTARGWHWWLVQLAAAAALAVPAASPAQAQGRRAPPPPTPKVVIHDPDPVSCQPDTIRQAFARHLAPFAGQSPAVMARLREVQLEMTDASLRRCVAKGLLEPDAAAALRQELSAQTPTRP